MHILIYSVLSPVPAQAGSVLRGYLSSKPHTRYIIDGFILRLIESASLKVCYKHTCGQRRDSMRKLAFRLELAENTSRCNPSVSLCALCGKFFPAFPWLKNPRNPRSPRLDVCAFSSQKALKMLDFH
jgi:hypothetical protein